MTNRNRTDDSNHTNDEVRHADPDRAATDPRAAAQQDQVKADHDALLEQSRRVESSVSQSVRDTPVQQSSANDTSVPHRTDVQVATDPQAAAQQDRVKADHDALEESARRVKASVPADVRDTPVGEPSPRRR